MDGTIVCKVSKEDICIALYSVYDIHL